MKINDKNVIAITLIALAVLEACTLNTEESIPIGQIPPTQESRVLHSEPISGVQSTPCIRIHDISVCVEDVSAGQEQVQVDVKLLSKIEGVTPGNNNSFILPDTENLPSLVKDEEIFPLKESNYIAEFDPALNAYIHALTFNPVPTGVNEVMLEIPIISVDIPAEASFEIDLGTNPQPGQVIPLNATVNVQGQIFHFIKAEFEGDGINSLRVTLFTDPLDLQDDIGLVFLSMGTPELALGWGSKAGLDGLPFRVFAELINQPGQNPISGIVPIDVKSISYQFQGPFRIPVQISKP